MTLTWPMRFPPGAFTCPGCHAPIDFAEPGIVRRYDGDALVGARHRNCLMRTPRSTGGTNDDRREPAT